MKKQSMRLMWVGLICALGLCVLIFVIMIQSIDSENNQAIRDVGSVYMDEMSTQLQQHFKTIIELRMDMVEGIILRTPPESYSEYSPEMIEQLKYNGQTRNFDYLALYTQDGTMEIIYGEPLKVVEGDSFLDSLNAEESKMAKAVNEAGQEMLVMGVSTTYPMEDGKVCTALIAGIQLEYINYAMSLGGDKSLCYSHIIYQNGDFVLRTEDNDYISSENYYEYLSQCEGEGESIDRIIGEMKAAVSNGEEYSAVVLVDGGAERRQIYCVPLTNSEWYLISVMPHGKLDEMMQSAGERRMAVSTASCLGILFLMLTIFILYYRMSLNQMKLLIRARNEADAANRAKSQFLSNMSHDIRTPMNAIVGMTAIAQANLDNPGKVQNCLNKIVVSSKHLLGLINDVLDMSKIESGKMTLNREPVSLREMLDGIVNIVQPQIKSKQQSFDVYIQNLQTEDVYCDGLRVNQVLLNLLSNALKFTPQGGRITVSVNQENSPKGEEYVRTHFRVRDNGVGMTEEFQKKVFESFVREDDARVRKIEGTGLGLAITKHIIDMAGGVIEVQSEQNKGTEFHVILDLKRVDISGTEMILPDWEMLVVDDDDMLCRSAVDSLKEIGAHAEYALSGAQAIAMAEQRHVAARDYHIILLDWQMPGMDGIETARELRRRIGEEVPILLISAYDWDDIEDEARAAGIQGFISKPLFKSTLYYGLSHYAIQDPAQAGHPLRKKANYAGRRLLIAEDNDLNWEIASDLLSSVGFTVEWAENGRICVDKVKGAAPGYYDAILMDLRMPVMDGLEATREIRAMDRADAKRLPIIAMTADAFAEDIRKCMDAGMNAHVAKPLDMQELLRSLQKYL